MTMSVVIDNRLRVLIGETMSDIYRQIRILSGREEEPELSATR